MFYCHKNNADMLELTEKKTGEQNDFIIYARTDGDYGSHSLPSVTSMQTLWENTIYIPEGKDYDGLNDQIAHGTKKNVTLLYCITIIYQNTCRKA